ncbi:hypothetical protein D3C87_1237550 [compost metagenome]
MDTVGTRPPPIICGVANALKVQANDVVMLAMMPGMDSGSVTVRKVRTGPAPRLCAAFS